MPEIFTNKQIRELAVLVSNSILTGNNRFAVEKLKPVLNAKYPFCKLDLLGNEIGKAVCRNPDKTLKTFDKIIETGAMGGYVIVCRALICFLKDNFDLVLSKSCEYIIKGDKWYVCDIIGERSLGQALVDYFDKALPCLEEFLLHENKWVKRSAGVAVHFFSKRVLNEPEKTKKLLRVFEPHIEEKQIDTVKGIGWGLKTIGKHHPDILTGFLIKQLKAGKKISKLMLKKSLTYLDQEKRLAIEKCL